MIEVLKSYLTSLNIVPVYRGFQPASSGIMLFQTQGRMPDLKYNYNRPSLQVRVVFDTYDHAQTIAMSIWRALIAIHHTTISGLSFIDIQPTSDPYLLEYDVNKRAVFIQNFMTEIYTEPNREG